MENDPEDYEEIISPAARGDYYYQVIKNDELHGFFCLFPQGESKVELGLGLKPEYCGQGQGEALLQEILDFVEQRFAVQAVSLSVASFNKRAQQLYRKCGFEIVSQREQESNGSVHLFLQMEKKLH